MEITKTGPKIVPCGTPRVILSFKLRQDLLIWLVNPEPVISGTVKLKTLSTEFQDRQLG